MVANRAAAFLEGAAGKPSGRHFRLGLAPKLTLAFIGLVALVLLVSAALSCWLGYRQAERQAVMIQQEKARDTVGQIEEFVSDIERQLGLDDAAGLGCAAAGAAPL